MLDPYAMTAMRITARIAITGRTAAIDEHDDAMHMIRHNDECIEGYVRVMLRHRQPCGVNQAANRVEAHLAADAPAEHRPALRGADRDVVCSH